MSFPNNPPPPPPQSQPFLQGPFFDGDVGGFWPQYPANHPSFSFNHGNPDFHAEFQSGPPFKRPRNSENNPSNFAPFPPTFNSRMNSPNLPGSKGTSHIFYKTRLCTKYYEGKCKNGEHCTFAHGQQDLREPPPNWQELVREKEKDAGPGNWNDDQRLIHKMKICKKFYNGEECSYGEKCNFLHERPNRSSPDDYLRFNIEVTRQRESSAISIGTRGSAIGNKTDADQQENNRPMSSNLDATRTKPVFWKTKLCSKWEITGQCPFGERCHFAHGQLELQGSTGRVDVEVPVNSGPIQTKPVAVPVIDASPTDALVGASVKEEGEDLNISKWKLNKKINSIYADWIYDDLDLTTPQSFSSENETQGLML